MHQNIAQFEAISLREMNAIRLMNRQDTKYIFHERLLPKILTELKEDYRILEIDGQRISSYENIYFESPNFDIYSMHQRGKMNRTKIRIRKYVESSLSFIEVKFKNNKSRTIKTRFLLEEEENFHSTRVQEFLKQNSKMELSQLSEEIAINFSRITLAHKSMEDRCTLDFNLQVKWKDQAYAFEKLVVAELKQEKFRHASAFNLCLKRQHIYPASFSKYCFGILKLKPELKHNNFKPKLHHLEKVLYD
ncbi:MAG: polyphosphate polymerase domain-containing protein [Chitinophagales bacterium]|nr:polyphosphate polymerase domain-containing protein [Bacteroidota bacterium]MCB9255912.1 polyphosphate polymerase domain-containing protein [Chitinophagales bacterium]